MILALCLLVFFYTLGQLAIKESRKDLGVNYSLCIGPLPGDLVRIFAGEFKGLVADYLLLELGSFMGSDQEISSKDCEKYLYVEKEIPRLILIWKRLFT